MRIYTGAQGPWILVAVDPPSLWCQSYRDVGLASGPLHRGDHMVWTWSWQDGGKDIQAGGHVWEPEKGHLKHIQRNKNLVYLDDLCEVHMIDLILVIVLLVIHLMFTELINTQTFVSPLKSNLFQTHFLCIFLFHFFLPSSSLQGSRTLGRTV